MAKEILIADSDKTDQQEFQKIFETTGYHLIFSESGEDAFLRTKLFKPDMIIASGGGLREMGGLEFCGAIRKDPDFEHIPFILISNIFGEISEKDRQHVRADGMISKPLNEDEVLNLVDRLMESGVGKREEMAPGKGDFSLDAIEEGEEEIIELLDVVEEPEPKVSIDDLVTSQKEEPPGEISSLDTWEKLEFEEKPKELEPVPRPEKEIGEINLQMGQEQSAKGASPEDDLFEKIELEEILEKVEQLKPSLEKEWPAQREEMDTKVGAVDQMAFKMEEPAEKQLDLSEFEAALRSEVKAARHEEELAPVSASVVGTTTASAGIDIGKIELEEIFEKVEQLKPSLGKEWPDQREAAGKEKEPKREVPEEAIPVEVAAEEEELKELAEEEFPDELLEEMLGEEEISVILEPQELKRQEVKLEEVRPKEARTEEMRMDRLEELETPEIFEGEGAGLVTKIDRPMQDVTSLSEVVDKQLEEVLAKGIQDMVGDFITKILPEMTQNIIGLTAERIEKMVKEVVPELAEKAIQEEIKRLQKGEKE